MSERKLYLPTGYGELDLILAETLIKALDLAELHVVWLWQFGEIRPGGIDN